jgi:predicted NodU family carbamoyl transferase
MEGAAASLPRVFLGHHQTPGWPGLTRGLAQKTGAKNLCLAGGVALNCVANGKVLRDGWFKNIWVQPAAGDAGGPVQEPTAHDKRR